MKYSFLNEFLQRSQSFRIYHYLIYTSRNDKDTFRFGNITLFLLVGQKYLNLMPDNSIVLSKESFKFYQTCPYTKPYAFNRFS